MNPSPKAQKEPPRFRVTFAADLMAIDSVVDGVMAVARSSKAAGGRELEIETSLREALANAIIHGSGENPAMKVECTAGEVNGEFVIVVTDLGGRLEVATLPDPTHVENLELGHGRGVHMMHALMDDVQILVDKGVKTEVRMTARPRPQED